VEGGAEDKRGRIVRRLLAGLVLVIAMAPIIAGAIITSGTVGKSRGLTFTVARPSSASKPPSTSITSTSGSTLPPGPGALDAIVRHSTTMRLTPAGRELARLGLRTEFGSPEALWVVAHSGGWIGVISPLAGNGHVGWIPLSAASLTPNSWKLEVSLSQRRLTVLYGGAVRARFTVAIGAPYAPTPTGRFAVTDRLNTGDPSGPYGCCILALSAKSPHAIQGWSGGDRIAIHSTPETSSIGLPVSHGCLRLTLSEGRWLLAHIPLGTPALITS